MFFLKCSKKKLKRKALLRPHVPRCHLADDDNTLFSSNYRIKKKKLNELCRPNLLTNEVRVTKKANHLNIIELYDQIESEDSLYLVLECADGGELFEMIVEAGRFSEPVAKVYFLQMLNAVKYLHSIQITHRDLKPENVLVGHRVENVSNKDSETAANHHRIIKIADMGK